MKIAFLMNKTTNFNPSFPLNLLFSGKIFCTWLKRF